MANANKSRWRRNFWTGSLSNGVWNIVPIPHGHEGEFEIDYRGRHFVLGYSSAVDPNHIWAVYSKHLYETLTDKSRLPVSSADKALIIAAIGDAANSIWGRGVIEVSES